MSLPKLALVSVTLAAGLVAGGCTPEETTSSHAQATERIKTVTKTKTVTVNKLSDACKLYVEIVQRMYDSIHEYESAKGDLTEIIDLTASSILRQDKDLQNQADGKLRALRSEVAKAVADMASANYSLTHEKQRCEVD